MIDRNSPPKRRLSADRRREQMLAAAGDFFSERGLDVSTREIAEALGVTQALIYKHFASKEDLVEQTLAQAFAPWNDAGGPWIDGGKPLHQELCRYYSDLAARASHQRMRLFIRAGLDGRSWPTRRGHALTRNLFLPLISALRSESGLPDAEARPPMRGERELCMMLHASVIFLGIRRHVYGMDMPDDLSDVVALYVATFLEGAPATMRGLHSDQSGSLSVRLATPKS